MDRYQQQLNEAAYWKQKAMTEATNNRIEQRKFEEDARKSEQETESRIITSNFFQEAADKNYFYKQMLTSNIFDKINNLIKNIETNKLMKYQGMYFELSNYIFKKILLDTEKIHNMNENDLITKFNDLGYKLNSKLININNFILPYFSSIENNFYYYIKISQIKENNFYNIIDNKNYDFSNINLDNGNKDNEYYQFMTNKENLFKNLLNKNIFYIDNLEKENIKIKNQIMSKYFSSFAKLVCNKIIFNDFIKYDFNYDLYRNMENVLNGNNLSLIPDDFMEQLSKPDFYVFIKDVFEQNKIDLNKKPTI